MAGTGGGGEGEAGNRTMGAGQAASLGALLPFIRPYRGLFAATMVALVATAALALTLPIAVRRVVDGFSAHSPRMMDQYFAAAIGIAALLAVGSGLRHYFVSRLGERVVTDIRKAVYDRMIGMSPAYFERVLTGEVLSRITTDTTLVQSIVGSSASIALRNIFILAGGAVLMFLTSAKLAAAAIIVVPLVVVPILVLGRRVRSFSRASQDRVAACSGNAAETLSAAQTVQAYTREDASRTHFGALAEEAFAAAARRIAARTQMTILVIFFVFSGVAGVLWLGARDVRSEMLTPGALVQFVIFAIMVAGAVAALSEVWGEIQRAAGATDRLMELLAATDTVRDPDVPDRFPDAVRGEITFRNVWFHYPSRREFAAVHDLSFLVQPGETVAFVGASGAGKSTVFRLLLRFFDPESGQVLVDGIDVRTAERSDFRRHLAYVPQEPEIFAASAMENIRFGRFGASDSEVVAAAEAAAAHDFLSRLPEGYETPLGERGVTLSGGQRQRIAIARAILRDAPVLLLDEATSALDSESEGLVQRAVEALTAGRTTLIVAHRLATVKKADRILVLEDGRLVSQGTHGELVAEGGLYARLAELQLART